MRITVHIPDKLRSKLKQTAQKEGISLSALTAEALEYYLKQKRKKAAGNRLQGDLTTRLPEQVHNSRVTCTGQESTCRSYQSCSLH